MRTHADAPAWVERGTTLLTEALATLDEQSMSEPSPLPGWSRKHLVAHVAANAEALGNLVHWARSGEKMPMYSSMEQRNADIEAGAKLTAEKLAAWFIGSAATLGTAMAELTDDQWRAEVVTAQGRTIPAKEIPWLRAREVCVHAVDLGTGVTFADLPEGFLAALIADVQAKRGRSDAPAGPLPEVAAYLAGRPHDLTDVPELGPWL